MQLLETHPDLLERYKDEELLKFKAILASKIEVVNQINDYALSMIPGDGKEYLSLDSINKPETIESQTFEALTSEFLNSLRTSSLPNNKIKLKVGTQIMLLRNIDQSEGLCNGTRLVITRLANHFIEGRVITDKRLGNIIYIPRPSQSPWPFQLIRRKFPIIVSYAMTINKSQGQ
uniref:ATP-dependent DNA helicase PIF1 n=1 Tax=Cajanus cajan TaxID=3821 RepID=A0A151RVI9_CAJCA|nr:ATP-dependent DNA helicase PIF1 [Cajanus cajan]KYP46565.1 ATP-dependent DNA helicase PIF1 [Cajanus cajan]